MLMNKEDLYDSAFSLMLSGYSIRLDESLFHFVYATGDGFILTAGDQTAIQKLLRNIAVDTDFEQFIESTVMNGLHDPSSLPPCGIPGNRSVSSDSRS